MGQRKGNTRRIQLPVWVFVLLLVNVAVAVGVVEYYYLSRRTAQYAQDVQSSLEGQDPQELVNRVTQKVIPASGYQTALSWGSLGKRLVEVGAIDLEKYKELFKSNTSGKQELAIFEGNTERQIEINENNARFVVNTLWALGLANKSKVLDEGPMKTSGTPTDRFASTGGWTLGTKPATQLYSSEELIFLTEEQQELVYNIAENVYRPCCGNHSAFPDCNHGMAALGYIELAVANGLSESEIYKDLLVMNSYWFPTTYVEMGVFFSQQGTDWDDVDPKLALSGEYSSAQGAQKIHQAVANVPGLESRGGSCGA